MAHEHTPEEIGKRPDTPAPAAGSARAIADQIFATRMFEGDALRMGQALRRVREALGLELKDIAAELKVREHYLMALERMETGPIPKGYVTVYLKQYAKYLGLDETTVLADYSAESGALDEAKKAETIEKIGEIAPQTSKLPLLAGAVAAIAIVAVGGFWIFGGPAQEDSIAGTPAFAHINGAHESLFSDANTRQRAVAGDLPLELVAVRQGWMEVRGADGTIFRSRTMTEGERYQPRLQAGWTISARDGGAFEWRVGDVVVDPLGPDATPVFAISVDAQLAKAADATAPAVASTGTPPTR